MEELFYLQNNTYMLLTFNDQYAMAQDLATDASTATLTTLKDQINVATGILRHQLGRYIFEESRTVTSVASQQYYQLPSRFIRIASVTYTSGGTPYNLVEVPNRQEWLALNQTSSATASPPQNYFLEKERVGVFPTPSAASDTLTIVGEERFREMTLADYATGTVTTVNGDATIEGASSPAWATAGNIKADGWFKVNNDGTWYEIASITDADTLELTKTYEGTSGATLAYTIGEQALGAYEDLHILPVWYALMQFYNIRRSESLASQYRGLWEQGLAQAMETYSKRSVSNVIHKTGGMRTKWGYSNDYPRNGVAL